MIKPRRMRWAGYVARMVEKRNAYRILVGNPEGKTILKCILREIGWDSGDWMTSGGLL
jgi:hypothetical protein